MSAQIEALFDACGHRDLPAFPAAFSPDRLYRYVLWRAWGNEPSPRYLMIIGLNPSTADETTDDPTLRRCIAFAKAWGFGALAMLNLFAFRATEPRDMKVSRDPIGPDNDIWLDVVSAGAGLVLAAWGTHGTHLNRHRKVLQRIPGLHALRLTKDGHPAHPLYLPSNLTPFPMPGARRAPVSTSKCAGEARP